MSEEDRSLASGDWFEKASRDWQQIEERLGESECADAAFLLQQSVEKYLKGYLVSKEWELKRTHDVADLLKEVVQYNSDFAAFTDLCGEISEYYFLEWNPSPSKVPSKERVEEILQQAQHLVGRIVEETRQ